VFVVLVASVPSDLVAGCVATSVLFLCISVYSPLVPWLNVIFTHVVPLVVTPLVGSPGLVYAYIVSYVSFQFPSVLSIPHENAEKLYSVPGVRLVVSSVSSVPL